MTEPLPLPSGATVRVQIPGPPTILAPLPAIPSVLYVPVPGPPGPAGAAGDGARVFGETPAGVQDGTNPDFVLAHTPVTGSVAVYRNGLREVLGIGFTVSAATLTFTTPPVADDDITVDYALEG